MRKLKKTAGIFMAVILAVSMMSLSVSADEQSDLEERNSELESEVAEEQERVDELEESISGIREYIETLESELDRIEGIIAGYEEEKAEKQATIEELNATVEELQTAIAALEGQVQEEQDEIDYQFYLMSLRIRFLYENVGNSYIEAIFSAGSFSEAVEKIEYLLELSDYDREIMQQIEEMVVKVKADQEDLEQKKTDVQEQADRIALAIEAIDDLQAAQEAQEVLYEETKALQEEQLDQEESELDEAQAVIDSFMSEIASNESRINAIISEYEAQLEAKRQAAEEAAAAEAAAAAEEAARIQAEIEEKARIEEEERIAAAREAAEAAAQEEEREVSEEEYEKIEQEIHDEIQQQVEEEIEQSVPSYTEPSSSSSQGVSFIWPLSGYSYVTSYFGYRDDVDIPGISSYHQGIDIYAPSGTPIMAVADGVVISNYWSDSIGWTIIIYHGSGLFTEFHHMCQQAPVSVGEYVYQGQTVGYVGATGYYCTGAHLHFGVSQGSSDAYSAASFVNPLNYY